MGFNSGFKGLIFKDQVGQYMARFLVKPTQKIITTRVKDNHLAVN